MSSAKRKFVIVLPPVLTVPSWSSSASAIILSTKMLKRMVVNRHPLAYSSCGSESLSYVVAVVDYGSCLVVEAFCGSDHVGIDVIQPHGCPQSCMPDF